MLCKTGKYCVLIIKKNIMNPLDILLSDDYMEEKVATILKDSSPAEIVLLGGWIKKYHGTLLAVSKGFAIKLCVDEYYKNPEDFVFIVYQKLCRKSLPFLEQIKDPLAYMIGTLKFLIIDESRSADFKARGNGYLPIDELEEKIPFQSPNGSYAEMIEHLRLNMRQTLFTVLLRDIEGFRPEEIAAELKITKNNVCVRLNRAKRIAQRLLKP
jgi:DNA-directed RNA polymerase specialized sigma24 family protein